MVSNPQLHEWLTKQLGLFTRDPATSDFQRGYLRALLAVAEDFGLATAVADMVKGQTYDEYEQEKGGEDD